MSTEWIEVRRCMWLHEAEFFRSVLDSAGITSQIPDEYMLGVQPPAAIFLGGVRVLVQPEDAGRAREILDSAEVSPDGTTAGENEGG
jgi:hypothetical protein